MSNLIPAAQVFPVERATISTLPAIEVIAISSSRVDGGPPVKHELSIEVTVSHQTEDGADELLDSIVAAIRAASAQLRTASNPISLAGGGNVLVELGATRWSISAADASTTIRGASIAVEASE